MNQKQRRSPFGRAIGLGSAKAGVENWWRERVAAVALVLPTLWFVGSIIRHSASDYTAFVTWLKMPFVTFMMALLLIALFYHTLQVVVEDYLHSAAKIPTLILVRLGSFVLAAAGILALLRIAFLN